MTIYVEILVRAPMDALWAHTQTPQLHERWDLRFTKIDYLPRTDDESVQRFRYSTRIGFGREVSGAGETKGERNLPDGSFSSALKFASDDPLSIIRAGNGYWKYCPTSEGVRFLTAYDYRTRFGRTGALFDRLVFRPLIGWATAWSFDRLRLWLERGQAPEQSARHAFIHGLARLGLATVFGYQGLVPKLLARSADEIALIRDAGIPDHFADVAVQAAGGLELLLAVLLLAAWQRKWPAWICLASMVLATAFMLLDSPRYFTAAFNPGALNLAVASIAGIDLLVLGSVPSATRCIRRPSREAP